MLPHESRGAPQSKRKRKKLFQPSSSSFHLCFVRPIIAWPSVRPPVRPAVSRSSTTILPPIPPPHLSLLAHHRLTRLFQNFPPIGTTAPSSRAGERLSRPCAAFRTPPFTISFPSTHEHFASFQFPFVHHQQPSSPSVSLLLRIFTSPLRVNDAPSAIRGARSPPARTAPADWPSARQGLPAALLKPCAIHGHSSPSPPRVVTLTTPQRCECR
jgi:hypothetical protein